MRFAKFSSRVRYTAGFAIGLVIFLAAPEGVRWINGGAVAQQALGGIYGNGPAPIIGDNVMGQRNVTVTTGPGQTGAVVGGETNMTVCPNGLAPGQGAIGTYVGPGGNMTVTVTANGGGGSATGYRSTMIVGGAGCK